MPVESATVRPAGRDDVPVLLAMIRELAAYEREPDAVDATEDALAAALFAPTPAVFAHVALADGTVVGFALWYVTFSTWAGRHGIWLEDLFVRPQHRGAGHGRTLLATLASICAARDYARLEWWVLDWNEPALAFYRSLGAVSMVDWTVQRLEGRALQVLAAS